MTSIEFSASANIQRNPFVGCQILTNFIVNGDGSLSIIEGGRALVRNGTELIAYPSASGSITMDTITKIGDSVFMNNHHLTDVSFPAVTSIGDSAFSSYLTSVTLGTIAELDFGFSPFIGNLRDVYFAPGGGAGTYTTSNPGWDAVWEKQ